MPKSQTPPAELKEERLQKFGVTYIQHLAESIHKNPEKYREKDAGVLTIRIMSTITQKGIKSIDIKTNTFKETAKELGIKNTYSEWEKYFDG